MTIGSHLQHFTGKKVKTYDPKRSLAVQAGGDVGKWAWRCGAPFAHVESDGAGPTEAIEALVHDGDATAVTAIIVGAWASWEGDESCLSIMSALVAGSGALSALEALHFADIVGEESEISWIELCDFRVVLKAFPKLRTLVVRGGAGLRFATWGHSELRSLRVESGGMPPAAVRDIGSGRWPALEHLELWLGQGEYGGGAVGSDVVGILAGTGFPALKYLGLMNSDCADAIAQVLPDAAILPQLVELDLSMGTLGDVGAAPLLANAAAFSHLRKVSLRHNYIGDGPTAQLAAWGNVSGAHEKGDDYGGDDDWRYTEIGE